MYVMPGIYLVNVTRHTSKNTLEFYANTWVYIYDNGPIELTSLK